MLLRGIRYLKSEPACVSKSRHGATVTGQEMMTAGVPVAESGSGPEHKSNPSCPALIQFVRSRTVRAQHQKPYGWLLSPLNSKCCGFTEDPRGQQHRTKTQRQSETGSSQTRGGTDDSSTRLATAEDSTEIRPQCVDALRNRLLP